MKYVLVVLSVVVLVLAASAQAQDTLVGTWNIVGENYPFIGITVFTGSGAVIENDTTNINPITSQSISMGTWHKTGGLNYAFDEENYLYDTSGNLIYIAVSDCTLTLAPKGKSYSDSCAVSFYTCSLSSCPGTLAGTNTVTATGTRF